jgi:hypothetical protein
MATMEFSRPRTSAFRFGGYRPQPHLSNRRGWVGDDLGVQETLHVPPSIPYGLRILTGKKTSCKLETPKPGRWNLSLLLAVPQAGLMALNLSRWNPYLLMSVLYLFPLNTPAVDSYWPKCDWGPRGDRQCQQLDKSIVDSIRC